MLIGLIDLNQLEPENQQAVTDEPDSPVQAITQGPVCNITEEGSQEEDIREEEPQARLEASSRPVSLVEEEPALGRGRRIRIPRRFYGDSAL